MDRSVISQSPARLVVRRLAFVGLLGLLAPAGVEAQHDHATAQGESAAPEMPLMDKVLGDFSRPVVTMSEGAQAYFDQGIQMVYAFTYPVAIRSFEEAQRQDPSCAMCYWGEALARGPMINSRMTEPNGVPAYEAAQKALSLIEETDDPVEKGLIRAIAVRYSETHNPDTRAALDSAYSQAMSELYRAHPEDLDVGALYAESLMLLNTERGTYRVGDPFVDRIHTVLKEVLAKDITHPGACHWFIHASEATSRAIEAEPCADILMTSIPGASHLNHMPSHTYNVLGRWGKAVRSNTLAWHSDQRAEFGEGVSYAGTHNLHMLFYAGSMDGQGALSAAAAEEYARQVNGGAFYHSMVLLRFGKFDEVLALTQAPEQPLQQGLWEFSRAYAHLRTGAADSASHYLARVEEKADTLPASVTMRGHTAADLLGITGRILRGEIMRTQGDLNGAIALFEEAVEIHDGLRYDEPEPLNFSARHWLGDALLAAERYADAEQVYRASLEQHPDNGWSYFGLEKALRAQGRDAEADAAQSDFETAWARADTMIRASIF